MSVGPPLHCMLRAPVILATDLSTNIGVVRETPPFRIDSNYSNLFGRSTYLDVAYPESGIGSVYEDGLVEGFYLLSLVDVLKKCTYQDDPSYYALNYGSNKLRFIEKVLCTDILSFKSKILNVKEKGGGYLVEVDCEFWTENITRPAVSYSLIYLLLPKGE